MDGDVVARMEIPDLKIPDESALSMKSHVSLRQVVLSLKTKRNYLLGSCLTFVLYLLFLLAFAINANSTYSICPYEHRRSGWTRDFLLIATSCLFVGVFVQSNRIFLSSFREEKNGIGIKSAYYASLLVIIMGALSHLSIFHDLGGVCIDYFG
jgi:hypothetical protein